MAAPYIQFLVVGFSNALVDLGTLNLLLILHPTRAAWSLLADNTLAVALALLNSYLWNTRWTFRATATHSHRQRVLFGLQALLNMALNNLVLLSLSGLFPPAQGIRYLIGSNAVKLVAMLAASTTSFVMLRTVVFRVPPPTPRLPRARGGRVPVTVTLRAPVASSVLGSTRSHGATAGGATAGVSFIACVTRHRRGRGEALMNPLTSRERDGP